MTLAELIAEARRLDEAYDAAVRYERDSEAHALWDEKCAFWDEHGPRLARVAELALIVRREASIDTTHAENRCACVRCQRMRAFDAAAGGDE